MPTKQNVLCHERSVLDVMELDQWESSPFFAPEFEYLVSDGIRYVLVLDRSVDSRRWNIIRRALYRWIHALPDGVELSLVSSNDVVLGWTKVTAENRDGLVGRIPRRPSNSSSLFDAIRLAHQVITSSSSSLKTLRAKLPGTVHKMDR